MSDDTPEVDTTNDFALAAGQNMPNHSLAVGGKAKYVAPAMHPIFRTQQSAMRFAAWLLLMAEGHQLPHEEGEHTLEQIMQAIRNT